MDHKLLPENHQDSLHNEDYDLPYNRQNFNHDTLIFTENRPKESLNGKWHFCIDQYDTGLRSGWNRVTRYDDKGRELPWDYDLDSDVKIMVPSCWNFMKPEYLYYEGSVWYARQLEYRPRETGERVFLRIGAANYDTKIFLNGDFLGNHYGGSTPFTVELTDKLHRQNFLQVCVNNNRTRDRVPMRNTDWFNYGGIYRDVELYRLKPSFIKDCRVYLVPDSDYTQICAEITVDSQVNSGEVKLEIPELGVNQSRSVADGKAIITVQAAPELWSPAHPKLYEVIATYQADQIRLKVGFRQIEVRGTKILLNGKELFLRGICVHEDDLKLGKVATDEDLQRRFAHAKQLGCNFMRLAHYPHTERASQMADEVGIMLWEEIPVYWAIDFENPATYRDAQNQLLELLIRDQNRASVIIWSVGNENADTDARFSFMSRLANTAKQKDPTRLVSAACLFNIRKLRIEDRLMECLDVIGLNEYYGWYQRDYDDLLQLGKSFNPTKPLIVTETGACCVAGKHGRIGELFTEEHMADVYRHQIEFVKRFDYIQGLSPWILYDFRTPRRVNCFQQGFNLKGLIAADKRTIKQAYYVLQKFYYEKQAEEESAARR
jgi:beta-glucuronidase